MTRVLPSGTVKRIHVDRAILAFNRKHGTKDPAWTIQTSKGSIKCHKWSVEGLAWGDQTMKPLGCGARMYIQTYEAVAYQ